MGDSPFGGPNGRVGTDRFVNPTFGVELKADGGYFADPPSSLIIAQGGKQTRAGAPTGRISIPGGPSGGGGLSANDPISRKMHTATTDAERVR